MRHEFRLADIGEGLEEAEIINWLVEVGDHVRRDQPLIEVMTDKSNAELPAPQAGIVTELGGKVGDMISVGELVAVITETEGTATTPVSESPTASALPQADPVPPAHASAPAPAPADTAPIAGSGSTQQRPKASPSTRRAAAEQGIDLSTVQGTGPGGRILLSDLDNAGSLSPATPTPATPTPATPAPATPTPATPAPVAPKSAAAPKTAAAPTSGVVALRGIRRAVAKNMAQSWSEIPHIHAFQHIDAEPLLALRAGLRTKGGDVFDNVTPLTFFVAAVARAVAEQPQANASLNMADETITYHQMVNVGVAVASDQGLVVPVLHGADRMDFSALAVSLAQLVRGAREAALDRKYYTGGTVTITNFGSLGGEQALPLIRPPESMIIGFGSIAKRPFVADDAVVARSTMNTVIGADHRLLDGDITTAVINRIGSLLVDPLQLVL